MIKRQALLFFLFFTIPLYISAQEAEVKGLIFDSKSKETLIGVSIKQEGKMIAVTDNQGRFLLKLQEGNHTLHFSYLGYLDKKTDVAVRTGENQELLVGMEPGQKQLSAIVVSAGKYEQKREEVTVSMEIIKPEIISDKNTTNLENFMNYVPGVHIMDGQANIRGGSGYTYGAGSRVMMLLDDLPLLSADASDIKWNYLPLENIGQIEVIKGASSALFGSSALNGVINLRTAFPADTPQTSVTMYTGLYNNPQRKEIKWWGHNIQTYSGTWFNHSQRFGQADVVIGGNRFEDQGYRELENEKRTRFNTSLRYRFKKIPGLSAGINTGYMNTTGGLYILWLNGDSGVYRPSGGEVQNFENARGNIDPYIIYIGGKEGKHSLKGRYFNSKNNNDKNQASTGEVYFSEYQYQRKYKNGLVLISGLSSSFSKIISPDLYGHHESYNHSVFTQVDKKFKRLTLSLGVRGEYFRVDTAETISVFNNDTLSVPVKPVFRSGINYRVFEGTFLRSSFGQGYRFPSIAEKFIQTNVGALKLFPNSNLNPESGWSAEIGLMQLLAFSNWKGYIDLAGFWTEYKDMMEFTFGYYPPASILKPTLSDMLKNFGAKSINVENARITGAEITFALSGDIGKTNLVISGGYTYTNPINLDYDAAMDTSGTAGSDILKYRFYHLAKADVQVSRGKWTSGISIRYNSYMINIDKTFEQELFNDLLPTYHSNQYILPGLKEYRDKHNTGDIIFDHRISWQFSPVAKLSFVTNNLLNREYMTRPGDVQAPRTTALQVSIKF